MKKIILSILSLSLFTFSSWAEEEKSYLKTKDEISMNVKKYFDSSSDDDPSKFAENFYAEDVEVFINDLVIKGKKNYIERLNKIHKKLIKNMKFEQLHIHTNYFSKEALAHDGKTFGEIRPEEQTVWTNAWATLTGIGRVTEKKISFNIHMDFRTSKGKVVEMLAYYDPTQMNEEIKALEGSK